MNIQSPESPRYLGWREWVALPDLGIESLKCKVDTGARTSALHAFHSEVYNGADGRRRVRFRLHPDQEDTGRVIECDAPVVDERQVTDSGGHREQRLVIRTPIIIGAWVMPIELTLTNRDTMRFRMLLGRTAMHRRFLVDPTRSFLAATPSTTPESLP
ncbi:ribosomal protein S6 modification protein [Acidihalobacter yilgarnensis]|uniref:Ribosomal protein S6 modification protein n=1 Tax=Acidihalobacter yilgarnensis TaxID=2819280 RepID=A0A1D8IPK6_9GAMM|nr:ATP-dependent zinc protease [Acidihalobacter yilgarnensis]AOU98391.1 ribosomal protein S6 modification protein [Acidihalobacter yilgarnensis]